MLGLLGIGGSDSGVDVGDIPASLRFRSAASAYLNRTFGTPTDNKKWTLNVAIKPGKISTTMCLFSGGTSSSNEVSLLLDSGGSLWLYYWTGSYVFSLLTTGVIRDPTSYYYVTVVYDTTQAQAGHSSSDSRVRFYVNGVQYATSGTLPSQNYASSQINAAVAHRVGVTVAGNYYFDGYLSRICFVDGQALDPTSFGRFNSTINEWVSKSQSEVKAVVDAGGTNSFMLDFDDGTSLTTLGYDKSSKGNNWTLNNFSLTAGTSYDHMLDVPGNSFATLNPLNYYSGYTTIADGNLKATFGSGASASTVELTQHYSYGKQVCEFVVGSKNGTYPNIGIIPSGFDLNTSSSLSLALLQGSGARSYRANGSDGAGNAYGSVMSPGDVVRLELDISAGTLVCFLNGTSQGTLATGLSGSYTFAASGYNGVYVTVLTGQAPLQASASYRSGADGYFVGTPSAGFKALCQANLPDVAPALLNPKDHHTVITVTKSGNTNFTLPWDASVYDTFFEIKQRNGATDWYQIDGLRGYDKILKSNSTAVEATDANVLGVSGTTCTLKSTLADGTYIISATKAGLSASRQTNTDGSITSTVSRNVDSGFSIILFDGTAANGTIGHGQGKAIKFLINKNRSNGAGRSWYCWHTGFVTAGNTDYIKLESTAAKGASGSLNVWNGTVPSTTVISIGSYADINPSGEQQVIYAYADSAIQKSFNYTGNGSADGPYVDCGFKPKWLMVKRSDTASSWMVIDSARDTYNMVTRGLYPNLPDAEGTGDDFDFTASGFKLRDTGAGNNASGGTYIFIAFADVPAKYSLAR